MNIQKGPWGGGNQFGKSLSSFLQKKGWQVTYDLKSKDIDLILLTEPRKYLQSCAFNDNDIAKYLFLINPNALVVHRVNECDERKGTQGVNKRILQANSLADHTIFVSSWLRNLYKKYRQDNRCVEIVLSGGNTEIFNSKGAAIWNKNNKLKLVTHHWGANFLKGFDIYKKLDDLLELSDYSNRFEFTYIGNLPSGFKFNNSLYIPPLSGNDLANELKKNHVYLTGSQNEPGGMHHIEGALCGLPILYRDSGSNMEYCKGYGIPFTYDNFEEQLNTIFNDYYLFKNRTDTYVHTSERMCNDYFKIFETLLSNKHEMISRRKNLTYLLSFIKALVFTYK